MGRTIGKLLPSLLLCVCLTGCWDEVTIQDLYYFTAIGYSYDNPSKQYELYAQVIDISSVAKKEGSSEMKRTSVFGHDKGESPSEALRNLTRTMQMNPNLDHVMTILLDESSIRHLGNLLDGINRNSSIRYGVNVLGADSLIGSLFQTAGKISLSPLNTDIYQPNSNKFGLPFTTNNEMRDLVRSYKGCPCTLFVPKLSMTDKNWVSNKSEKLALPIFDGAFVLNNGKYVGKFDDKQLEGVRWFKGESHGRIFPIKKQDKAVSILGVKRTSSDYRFRKSPSPSMKLKLSVQVVMTEVEDPLSEDEVEKLAAKEIMDQIKRALELARSKGIDLFGIEEHLYRYHESAWKKMKQEKTAFEQLPCDVKVAVHLLHSGKMKLKRS